MPQTVLKINNNLAKIRFESQVKGFKRSYAGFQPWRTPMGVKRTTGMASKVSLFYI